MTNAGEISGFINFWKDKDIISRKALNKIIYYIKEIGLISKKEKVGYVGILDPFAEGILPIGIGKATKIFPLLDFPKEYLAEMQLGIATTTYDNTGQVVATKDAHYLTRLCLEKVLPKFQGKILQQVPPFSAVKVKGKRLYKIARENLDNVPPLPQKEVNIYTCCLFSFVPASNPHAYLKVKCSAGTYIRSLAVDIGNELGLPTHLVSLSRLSFGNFTQQNSIKLEDLLNMKKEEIIKNILPCDYPLEKLPQIKLDEKLANNFILGQSQILTNSTDFNFENLYKVYANYNFLGLGKLVVEKGNIFLKPEKVISTFYKS